jgi:DtxR family Mn-dependent transcriptional regulator
VIHVEDEPASVYRTLAAAGFAPDVRLRVERAEPDGMDIRIAGRSVSLAPEAVTKVLVEALPDGERFDERAIRLSDLLPGQEAEVLGISPLIRGLARSRLLDLGIVPGTVLEIDLVGPAGDPVAYRVRGASIALRQEQSNRILVRRKDTEKA